MQKLYITPQTLLLEKFYLSTFVKIFLGFFNDKKHFLNLPVNLSENGLFPKNNVLFFSFSSNITSTKYKVKSNKLRVTGKPCGVRKF